MYRGLIVGALAVATSMVAVGCDEEESASTLRLTIDAPFPGGEVCVAVATLDAAGETVATRGDRAAASREGARASSLSESAADVTSIVQASSPGAAQLGFPGSTALTVVQTPCNPATKGELTSVTVSTNFRFFTPVGLIKWYDSSSTGGDDMQLHSTSEMLCVG